MANHLLALIIPSQPIQEPVGRWFKPHGFNNTDRQTHPKWETPAAPFSSSVNVGKIPTSQWKEWAIKRKGERPWLFQDSVERVGLVGGYQALNIATFVVKVPACWERSFFLLPSLWAFVPFGNVAIVTQKCCQSSRTSFFLDVLSLECGGSSLAGIGADLTQPM